MSLISFNSLKITRDELKISKHVPITHLNEPTIFESSNAMLGMVIKIAGTPFNTEETEVLNRQRFIWHQALSALDDRFCIYETIHRRQVDTKFPGKFDNDFARKLDQQYYAQFNNKKMYINDIYLTVVYQGVTVKTGGRTLNFLQSLRKNVIKGSRQLLRAQQIKQLKQAVTQLISMLGEFKPYLLGVNDHLNNGSELLQFLSILINGGQAIQHQLSVYASPISQSLLKIAKNKNNYPCGHIGQYITRRQIFFGEYIQFQSELPEEIYYGAIITVKRYSTHSSSIMLDSILQLDSEFIRTNSFAIVNKETAEKFIQRHMIKMKNVNDPAVSQINALHIARDLLASHQLIMGYHHNTILLLAKSILELKEKINQAIKCYAEAGFVAVRETLGQEPAFWAQIPTNLSWITRASLITSENFVDFCPLHNYQIGYQNGNHLGSAITLLSTPARTPYFFNYHVRGCENNPSKGHAVIIGGNNSGKTVLLTFLDAQMSRYGGCTFYFDRDRGAEIYMRASNGYYAVLSPNYHKQIRFNPLQLPDSAINRQFNYELLSQFCRHPGEKQLDPTIYHSLKLCVDYAYNHLLPQHRNLFNATKLLPIDFPRRRHLQKWLRSAEGDTPGQYAYIFDNNKDELNMQNKMGFDLTYFLDHEPPEVRTALLMYLFHRIDQQLNGQRVSIILDEGWQYFIDSYWQEKLKRWLPTLRKRNAHLVIATQSPSSVINSPLRHVVLDNIATQIYFANPQATMQDYIDGFRLTSREYQLITKNSPQTRLFLVKQEHESSLCQLDLMHLPHLLSILSANTHSVKLLDQIRKRVGDNPREWLPIFYQEYSERRG